MSRQQLLRFSGALFLLAGVAFWFSPDRWACAIEAPLGILLLIAAARAGRKT